MTEAALVSGAILDEPGAYEQLVNLYYGRVFLHAIRRLGSRLLAEEATQETFLKAFTSVAKLREPSRFAPWLFTICNNEVNSLISAQVRDRNLALSIVGEMAMTRTQTPSEHPGPVYAAIDHLSPELRDVIIFRYFAGFRLGEIALLLGVPEKRVKSRLYEARIRLKGLLLSDIFSHRTPTTQSIRRRRHIMDVIQLMRIGATVVPWMSTKAQVELFGNAFDNERFGPGVLEELGAIDMGKELAQQCDGRLSLSEFTRILTCCDDHTVKRLVESLRNTCPDRVAALLRTLRTQAGAGYLVNAVEIVLNVASIEETVDWYRRVLGWDGDLDVFGDDGLCTFGCISPDEKEGHLQGSRAFHGVNLTRSATPQTGGTFNLLIYVMDIESLNDRLKSGGLTPLPNIEVQPWGARTVTVRDPNGYMLVFAELAG